MGPKWNDCRNARLLVMVVPLASRSTSPDWRPEKRCSCVYGMNWTLFGSLNNATAIARQKSTSKPRQRPASSGVAKPAPSVIPHLTAPRARTALKVGVAPPAAPLGVAPGVHAVVQAVRASPTQSAVTARLTPNGANGEDVMTRPPLPGAARTRAPDRR